MKKFIMLLSVIALVMIAMVPAAGKVSAQAFPGYITGTQVMNLGTVQATVILDYYNTDDGSANAGAKMDTANDAIDPSSSKTYFPTLTTFKGSMVISSSQPLGAVTNLQNSAKTAGASYIGASKGSSKVQIPLLMKNNGSIPYTTWYSVQNTGSVDATVTVTYSDIANPVQFTVKPNAAKTIYQAAEAHPQKVFSASLSSTQPVVVVVVEENSSKIFAYNGFNGDPGNISPRLVMPLINSNNNGFVTGVQIQNTGSTATTVTLSYTPSLAGTACTETQTIGGNSSATFALIAFSTAARPSYITTNCAGGVKFVGSAQVTANSANAPLVGIVNQNRAAQGEAYGAFNPDLPTPKVVMPLLMGHWGNSVLSTAFSLMNVGTSATNVKCTVSGLPAGVTYAPTATLQPNQAFAPNQGTVPGKFVGAGICIAYSDASFTTVDTNAKIVAVVNEAGSQTIDSMFVYEGMNVAP